MGVAGSSTACPPTNLGPNITTALGTAVRDAEGNALPCTAVEAASVNGSATFCPFRDRRREATRTESAEETPKETKKNLGRKTERGQSPSPAAFSNSSFCSAGASSFASSCRRRLARTVCTCNTRSSTTASQEPQRALSPASLSDKPWPLMSKAYTSYPLPHSSLIQCSCLNECSPKSWNKKTKSFSFFFPFPRPDCGDGTDGDGEADEGDGDASHSHLRNHKSPVELSMKFAWMFVGYSALRGFLHFLTLFMCAWRRITRTPINACNSTGSCFSGRSVSTTKE
mmetsp:Transcript_26888/g.52803  ORF Transcript_26888/g.52803 Transcript_26888/m.52803 type:complete len:284 (+) Transcript_26888:817-1668(+)